MSDTLVENLELKSESGQPITVEGLLGSGGQGEVWQAMWKGAPHALKWYYPHTATPEQLAQLRKLAHKGAPDSRFLWPLDIIPNASNLAGFGYVMKLRAPQFRGVIDLMARRSEPTFRVLSTVGLQLAECYLHLHAKGQCYCDISFGNVFWNDQTGDVLICDNDNVIENGETAAVAGTIGFMAPEVTTGSTPPSIKTDKHSLAVLLFYIFMLHHPLRGMKEEEIKALDSLAKRRIYGEQPIFIFDPNDDTNRPHPLHHKVVQNFWPIYPQFLQSIFTTAFTDGLKDPDARVTENQWRAAMVRLRDSIVYCGCGAENFYDQDQLKQHGTSKPCWACGNSVTLPFRIRLGRSVVMLNSDTKLFPHHIDSSREYDFSTPVAEVSRHPRDHQRWGLKNLGLLKWTMCDTSSNVRDVQPGQSAELAQGVKINFGQTECEIRY
ncbi:protein kinase domain-containing protein [Schlesneria paludicola]|uniref:protein kinase domain-containing protein n=1 Tax=Schlesneria paludicola TaxID=360056 RepID=UPI00029A67E3|nr:serine/threonine protein kinase [Schlesneria paludicola]